MATNSTSSVTEPIENDSVKHSHRLALYKNSYMSNESNQAERRWKLLQEQKKKRDESFNANRGLIETITNEEDAMDWTYRKVKPKIQKAFANRLMFSEWLEHVPEDLAQLWYIMPCPVGHRSLVVASGGNTRSFTKTGIQRATFNSALPGGCHEDRKGCTILDCIWSIFNYTYYILDVLAWGNQPMLDCEAEFRFYWLKTKLEEMPTLSLSTDENVFTFVSLPYHPCDHSVMTNIMATEHLFGENGPDLDGLLFYHSQTHYIPGYTPLVGWLKPHMMPVALNVPVAAVYLQKERKDNKRRNRKKCKNIEVEMEAEPGDRSFGEMETNILDDIDGSHQEPKQDFYLEEMEPYNWAK